MSTDLAIFNASHIILPNPEEDNVATPEREVCIRFLRHLSAVPNSSLNIKILSSIQFTADFQGYSDAHTSKVLVDHGLRAPRAAFSADYLEHVDKALMRDSWEVGSPTRPTQALAQYWIANGEDIFEGVDRSYPLLDETIHA